MVRPATFPGCADFRPQHLLSSDWLWSCQASLGSEASAKGPSTWAGDHLHPLDALEERGQVRRSHKPPCFFHLGSGPVWNLWESPLCRKPSLLGQSPGLFLFSSRPQGEDCLPRKLAQRCFCCEVQVASPFLSCLAVGMLYHP